MPTKAEVRLAIRERLKKLGEKDRATLSRVICRQLKKILGDEPHTIGVYLPFVDEPDIRPLIVELIGHGWAVCIPSVPSFGKKPMVFKRINELSDVKRDPVTGIPQPVTGTPLENEEILQMIVVPGRAFTSNCNRLGRGGGGYDNWIRLQRLRNPSTKYIGICFECQILQEIPLDPHDQRMDMVITSKKNFGVGN